MKQQLRFQALLNSLRQHSTAMHAKGLVSLSASIWLSPASLIFFKDTTAQILFSMFVSGLLRACEAGALLAVG